MDSEIIKCPILNSEILSILEILRRLYYMSTHDQHGHLKNFFLRYSSGIF